MNIDRLDTMVNDACTYNELLLKVLHSFGLQLGAAAPMLGAAHTSAVAHFHMRL